MLDGMWLAAWYALAFANASPSSSVLDGVFGFAPIAIIGMDYRSRQAGLSRPGATHVPGSVFQDHKRESLVYKLSLLWIPKGIVAEVLFFGVVVMEPVREIFGTPAVDWLRVETDAIALLLLFLVWRYLRKMNRSAGQLLQAQIDKLDEAKAQASKS